MHGVQQKSVVQYVLLETRIEREFTSEFGLQLVSTELHNGIHPFGHLKIAIAAVSGVGVVI